MFCGRKLFQHIVTRLNIIYLTKITENDLNKTEPERKKTHGKNKNTIQMIIRL
jgi:hypothetical protein